MPNKIDEKIADPTASIWISASAGTGKTKSLIDRILALLFNGVQPNKILCLTYTNAAANEMQERLQKIIADLQKQNDVSFPQFPHLSNTVINKLYEQSLSTEWVSIQTIHSYCFSILQRFSIESGLQPNVKLLDDFSRKQLLNAAINDVMNDGKYHEDLSIIAKYSNSLHEIVEDIDLSKISDFLSQNHQLSDLYANIFNIDLSDLQLTENQAIQKTMKNIGLENYRNIFKNLAEQLSKSDKKTDLDNADALYQCAENLRIDWIKIFLTEGEIRKKLCTKSVEFLQDKMKEIADKAVQFKNEILYYEATKCNIAFFKIMRGILENFRKLKLQNHSIDFDDVIDESIVLLKQFDWVCYKVDNSIEHVLVDEAQDTSPKQWEVVRSITSEFFTNYQSTKTIFIVGDEKQSIYSFQGADVEYFQLMHDFFKKSSEQCGQNFLDIQLNKSYRTTGGILNFVDDVFACVNNFPSTKHETARDKQQGIVYLQDLIESIDESDNDDYSTESQINLAKQIVDLIENAIKNHLWIPSKNRTAQPSDFLVLFQTRKLYAIKTMSNMLKSKNISVCDPDQIDLHAELLVQDLLSLAKFCLLPTDDLALAQVLTSPIVGITHEELEEICVHRAKLSLWNYIQSIDLFKKYNLEILQRYIDSTNCSPYKFFSNILNDGILEKFEYRLGNEVYDVIEKFLEQTELYERNMSPILQDFVNWFQISDIKIKREIDAQNGVRIMTVHGSKGLQAPFVIIADSTYDNNDSMKDEKILQSDNRLFWNFSSAIKCGKAKLIQDAYDNLKKKNIAESNRLLYVAMTRAEDFLCFCGIKSKNKLPENCWYNIVSEKIKNTNFINEQYDNIAIDVISFPKPRTKIPDWYFEKLEQQEATPAETSDEIIYGNCVHDLLDKIGKKNSCDIDFENIYEINEEQFQQAKTEAISVYNTFPFLFDESTQSEVEIIFEKRLLRIDKLIIKNNSLLILDFKTGERNVEKLKKYTQQLALYENAITATKKYYGYKTSKAILWTKILQYEDIF